MNISKEVLELDFNKIYDNLELPKCITSFLMYCCDVVSSRYKPFNYDGKIGLIDTEIGLDDFDGISWSLYDLYDNGICVPDKNLINFNKQLPE